MRRLETFLAFAALTLTAGSAFAADPPETMHYQGVLRDAADAPLDGTFDMIFRFFDADLGGSELLIDEHLAAGTGAVIVTGGMFGVSLGTGNLLDGTGAGTYASLSDVFSGHADVWVQIEIDGGGGFEALSPRVRVAGSAYAHNASHVQGLDATQLLRSDVPTRFDGGTLTFNDDSVIDVDALDGSGNFTISGTALDVHLGDGVGDNIFLHGPTWLDGTLHMDGPSPEALQHIFFKRDGAADAYFRWNDAGLRFELSDRVDIAGSSLTFGGSGPQISNTGNGLKVLAGTTNSLDDIELVAGKGGTNMGLLRINGSGPMEFRADQHDFQVASTGETRVRVNALDGELETNGPLCAGRLPGAFACDFNRFGTGGPDSGMITSKEDLYVAGNFEAESAVVVGTDLLFIPYLESFTHAGPYFELSDSLKVEGGFLEGRDAGNFEVVSTSSLHLVGNAHVRTMIDDDANASAAVAAWYHNGLFNTTGQLAELQEDGDFRIGGTLFQNVSFDLAESFLAAEPLEPGDVVALDPTRPGAVRRARGAGDPLAIGIVSTEPGFVLGGAPFDAATLREVWGDQVADRLDTHRDRLRVEVLAAHPDLAAGEGEQEIEQRIESLCLERFHAEVTVPVALAGRVPVSVDASYGPIRPGDALTASPRPGFAMRSSGSGVVIGTALESLELGTGSVLAFVQRVERTDVEALAERTPHPETGMQTVKGNLQVVLDDDADDRARLSVLRDGGSHLASEVFRVDERGNVYARGSFRPASMDVAELFPVGEPVEPGDVLAIDRERTGLYVKSRTAGDPAVIGIVAAEPGVILGADVSRVAASDPRLARELDDARALGDQELEAEIWERIETAFLDARAPVALSGTVDVKVDAGYGAIVPGDLLVASPTPGRAMRVAEPVPGTVIGKALEGLETGTGKVRVLVMLR